MNTNQHLVSIVMPCYNAGAYIAQALKAISEQTYTNWELIAVDDCGPKDGTEEILLEFAKTRTANQIRFIKHENNKGVSAARNTGIKNAKGTFIALLDPDDFWTPKHLEKAISTFNTNKELYFYSSFAYLFTGDNPSNITGIEAFSDWELRIFPNMFCIRNAVPTSSSVLRSKVFQYVDLFDESIRFGEDYDLWVRILKEKLKIFINREPTIYYRKHQTSATSNAANMYTYREQFADKHRDWLIRHQRSAFESASLEIMFQEKRIEGLKEDINILKKRIDILDQTIHKFKMLPGIKQLLYLKKKVGKG